MRAWALEDSAHAVAVSLFHRLGGDQMVAQPPGLIRLPQQSAGAVVDGPAPLAMPSRTISGGRIGEMADMSKRRGCHFFAGTVFYAQLVLQSTSLPVGEGLPNMSATVPSS